ncbi:uncharacterized protein [Haliotis cracherodii]|uniref:uncharacterized protein n=1 Tax=Haliotis cracherodii TaxID=6455 RepID=UPI0039E7B6A6
MTQTLVLCTRTNMWPLIVFASAVCISAQVYDPTCLDKLPDCERYGHDSCVGKYADWARDNCNNTCRYCIGPTKAPPPCVNTLADCEKYGTAACSDPKYKDWSENHCRYFCRKCSSDVLAKLDAIVTTMSPALCRDKVNCREYTTTACTGQYAHWAKENCPVFCGLCTSGPTAPTVCADTIPDCARYSSVCSDSHYLLWVQDNCRKYCGLCPGGGPVQPVTPGPGAPTVPAIVTPQPHFVTPVPPGK